MQSIRLRSWYMTPWLLATAVGIVAGFGGSQLVASVFESTALIIWLATFWIVSACAATCVFFLYGLIYGNRRHTSMDLHGLSSRMSSHTFQPQSFANVVARKDAA